MNYVIAIAHIGGSILTGMVLGVGVFLLGAWELRRNERKLLEELSLEIGIPVEELNREDVFARLIEVTSRRYSSELFRNRLSDLCGGVRTAWVWLGSILQLGIIAGVTWFAFTDNLQIAVCAWWIIAIQLVFWIISVGFSLLCRLLTGRYPGQAGGARKSLAELLSARRGGSPH